MTNDRQSPRGDLAQPADKPPRLAWRRMLRAAAAAAAAGVLAAAAASCGSGGEDADAEGGVVITCATCQADPTNPFLQYHYEVVQRFNKEFSGRYRVKVVKNQYASGGAERLQHYQRLALANDLPDLFTVNPSELAKLQKTGKLMNLADMLADDGDWRDTFHDDAFSTVEGDNGEVWALPSTRDAIGVYYNKKIFGDAGVAAFPQTWDEFAAACEKIKSVGKTCFGMDGNWVTLLMWANLIGTQPDGADFLTSGIAGGDYAGDAAVVKATETLKGWHTSGFVNSDAFSGEYPNAATAFVRRQAAMIANGPWMVSLDIKSDNAAKGLYEEIGYEISPGWSADQRGVIIVAGEGSWASGAADERRQEAVVEFLKYYTSREEAINQVRAAGAYPAVRLDLSDEERDTLEPLAAGLVEQANSAPLTFPHAPFAAPAGFSAAWQNLWPAYVKDEMDTAEFLERLAESATSPTG